MALFRSSSKAETRLECALLSVLWRLVSVTSLPDGSNLWQLKPPEKRRLEEEQAMEDPSLGRKSNKKDGWESEDKGLRSPGGNLCMHSKWFWGWVEFTGLNVQGLTSEGFFFFFLKNLTCYLFMRDRGRDIGKGWDHDLSQRLNH